MCVYFNKEQIDILTQIMVQTFFPQNLKISTQFLNNITVITPEQIVFKKLNILTVHLLPHVK